MSNWSLARPQCLLGNRVGTRKWPLLICVVETSAAMLEVRCRLTELRNVRSNVFRTVGSNVSTNNIVNSAVVSTR